MTCEKYVIKIQIVADRVSPFVHPKGQVSPAAS